MNARRLAAVAGTALAMFLVAAPASSQAPTLAAIMATDNVFTTDGGGPPNVTIAAGGHVNFAYFMGNNPHNVVFTGALPTVCGSSGGPPGHGVGAAGRTRRPRAGTAAVTSRRPGPIPSSAPCTAT